MTNKQIIKPDLNAFLISEESRSGLEHLISEVKDGIGIKLETPDTLSVLLNKIEYQTGPGEIKELKIRPYVLITLDNTLGIESAGKVTVTHIYNKTTIYLAAIGLGGLMGLGFLSWYFMSRKSRGLYREKRGFLSYYWPLAFKWK